MIQAMLVHSPALRERNFDALKTVLYGASAISAETLRQILEVFEPTFYGVYGQSEATGVVTMLWPARRGHRARWLPRPPTCYAPPVVQWWACGMRVVDKRRYRPAPMGRSARSSYKARR